MTRRILHADMDAFYASIEQRDDPALRGRPVIVGGPAARGVVAAASYEVRAFGVHSAMPTARALARCPEAVLVPPRIERYADVSRQVFAIFRSYSPAVEGLSLDEAFIDLSGSERLHGSALEVARAIKRRVREQLELVVSIGIGPSKFIAKIASDLDKPDGLRDVAAEQVEAFLHPLPVRRVFGVGKVTERQLETLGIATIGQLAAFPKDVLVTRLGQAQGEHLHGLARGIDDRPVVSGAAPKSLGAEDTFAKDVDDLDELSRIVRAQAEQVGRRLRARGLAAKVVVLKIKSDDFRQRTRRKSLGRPSADGALLARVALELLPRAKREIGAPLRLTGVTATELCEDKAPEQLSFAEPQRERGDALARTLDAIAERFGQDALHRGPKGGRNLLRRVDRDGDVDDV